MLKIFESINKKTERKIQKYAQKDIDELSRILNRPREGEIVKISDIKIRKDYKKPKKEKMQKKTKYYEMHRYFKSTVILDDNNYLVDGYTSYLLAKELEFDFITVVRN